MYQSEVKRGTRRRYNSAVAPGLGSHQISSHQISSHQIRLTFEGLGLRVWFIVAALRVPV